MDSVIESLIKFDAIPGSWVRSSVGDLFRVVGGGTPATSKAEYWEGNIPWISSADIYGIRDIRPRRYVTKKGVEQSATAVVPEGSVIVVTRVGLGKLAVAPEPMCFSQDSQALIAYTDDISAQYQLHFLSWAVQSFQYRNRGTTIAGVTKAQLRNLPFPLPP